MIPKIIKIKNIGVKSGVNFAKKYQKNTPWCEP